MFQVQCPNCSTTREVSAKKPWMKGKQPFQKICKSCCQTGKPKTEEHKQKLSISVKAAQTEELLHKKSQFMQDHPEIWQSNLKPELGSQAWTGQTHTEEAKQAISNALKGREVSLETRQKISETMKGNNNES